MTKDPVVQEPAKYFLGKTNCGFSKAGDERRFACQ